MRFVKHGRLQLSPYCLAHTPQYLPMDAGVGSGYQQIFAGEALSSAALLIHSPFLLDGFPANQRILDYVQRYLIDGTQSYKPSVLPSVTQLFEAAVAEHNAAAPGNGWTLIGSSNIQSALTAMQLGHGKNAISHHSELALRTVKAHFGIAP